MNERIGYANLVEAMQQQVDDDLDVFVASTFELLEERSRYTLWLEILREGLSYDEDFKR